MISLSRKESPVGVRPLKIVGDTSVISFGDPCQADSQNYQRTGNKPFRSSSYRFRTSELLFMLMSIRYAGSWLIRNQRCRKVGNSLRMLDSRWTMSTNSQELRSLGSDLIADMSQSYFMTFSSTTVLSAPPFVSILTPGDSLGNRRSFSSNEQGGSIITKESNQSARPQQGYGPSIRLTDEEDELFSLLRKVREDTGLMTTLRVAGGWVRDKLLATPEFQAYHTVFDVAGKRLTSKFQKPAASLGRQGTKVLVNDDQTTCQPVDIDVALDDMLGREFADHLNEYLTLQGKTKVSIGVVLKNPEKSKHLETATMKIGPFWVDFVNLRAEEYTQDSRIPEMMRIGTPTEDALRRDLTINALFYNINTGQVEDWTGRGFSDLRRGIVSTPLHPLTTLLDDPLRVLRAVRFAARLRFTMARELVEAATNEQVRSALEQKVSRERVGGEVDLMIRSPDPVCAMRLLVNLKLADTVFPLQKYLERGANTTELFDEGLKVLSIAHDHLADCRLSPPLWCRERQSSFCTEEVRLTQDTEAQRLLWYATFFKPFWDFHVRAQDSSKYSPEQSRKANRSAIYGLLVEDLKRPARDAEAVERIIKASDDFSHMVLSGADLSATMILLSDVRVRAQEIELDGGALPLSATFICTRNGHLVESAKEDDPLWEHAMQWRLQCATILRRIGPLWRAALFLAIAERLCRIDNGDLEYSIEGDVVQENQEIQREGVMESFDAFATAMQQVGLIGIWNEKPLLDGDAIKQVLPNVPRGPSFRAVMDEQVEWMTLHPGADASALSDHLRAAYPDFL